MTTAELSPHDLPERLAALVAAVRARTPLVPRLGLVLGSGLGGLAEAVADPVSIPFAELPGWPAPSAPGHAGRLLLGSLEGVPVACLQGRLHLYEGLPLGLVIQPVLLMGRLGATMILLTNAAGGVNPAYEAGTLMLIRDHLNLTG
ncbi:MAG: purine-nucleoside phosphorylase, partial [Candidatus Limnocylindrales bacterium]